MDKLTVKRGDTLRAAFLFVDGGAQADLSGCKAEMQIRKSCTHDLVASGSSTTGELVIDDSTGTILASMPTEEIPPGDHEADIEITYPDDSIRSSATFVVTIEQDITYEQTLLRARTTPTCERNYY